MKLHPDRRVLAATAADHENWPTAREPPEVVLRERRQRRQAERISRQPSFSPLSKDTPMSGGRPAFKPDDNQRLAVTTLVACGTRFVLIAKHIGVDGKTLRRHFRKELDEGRQDANALVARSLFGQALAGNITAQIFWLKTRGGWKETNNVEMVGANGKPLIPDLPMLGISWADGGPGLPVLPKPTSTFDDTPERARSDSDVETL